ncbi:MAG TPA: hypothetical protein VHE13_05040 [Opitutus sp.]|nr:hypothetical protein [Opitutus sp.]
MKTLDRKTRATPVDPVAQGMLRALRRARKAAAQNARLHKVPLVYISRGKIIRQLS